MITSLLKETWAFVGLGIVTVEAAIQAALSVVRDAVTKAIRGGLESTV